jgi:hypothetical protein
VEKIDFTQIDLQAFARWQAEDPGNRSVSIQISPFDWNNNIWVFDYALDVGQHVTDVSQIDLQAEKEKKDRELLAQLQATYGQKNSPCANKD